MTAASDNFACITLNKWEDIHSLQETGWLYRGHQCEQWDLQTSLERCCKKEGIKPEHRHKLETELLRDFQRAYHQYAQHIPKQNSTAEWLSLMQHHGAPTRLLDFTYSIYVAAYFALEKAKADCAVWAVNWIWVLEQAREILRKEKPLAKHLLEQTKECHEKIYHNLLFEEPFIKVALHLNPFRLNERLRIQRAAFIASGTVSDTFLDNLFALDVKNAPEKCIKKILIPYGLREKAIEHLYYMNISQTSLFPGLDGYARSLGVFHPSFRPDPCEHLR